MRLPRNIGGAIKWGSRLRAERLKGIKAMCLKYDRCREMLDSISAVLGTISAVIIAANSVVMLLASAGRARPLEVYPEGDRTDVSVAILVPAYREGPHIRYVLRSLKFVEYPKDRLKLIVVGERDDLETYHEIARICEVDGDTINCGGVRGVYLINASGARGKPSALNFALKYVDADVVAVYDAEDSVHPNHVSIAVRLLEDESVAAVQFVREMAQVAGRLGEAQVADFYFYYLVIQPYLMRSTGLAEICGSAFFIKHSVLRRVGGFNTASPAEDLDLTYRIGALGLRVLIAQPPSITRPIVRVSSLVKQRARWIRGGLLSIPTGLRAAPRTLPLLLITGFMPVSTVTSTLTVLLGIVGLVSGCDLSLCVYAVIAASSACSLGLVPVSLSSTGRTIALKNLAVMSAIYYLASWRAIAELIVSPRDWSKSEFKA